MKSFDDTIDISGLEASVACADLEYVEASVEVVPFTARGASPTGDALHAITNILPASGMPLLGSFEQLRVHPMKVPLRRSLALFLLVGCGSGGAPVSTPEIRSSASVLAVPAAAVVAPTASASVAVPVLSPVQFVAAVPPPPSVCSITGSNRPTTQECDASRTIPLSSDPAGKMPLVEVRPVDQPVTFKLSKGSMVAWVEAEDKSFRAVGYTDLTKETFRLTTEASVFDGHVRLLKHAPVSVSAVEDKRLGVQSFGDIVDLSSFDFHATCASLEFTKPTDDLVYPSTGDSSPTGPVLHAKTTPGGPVAFVIHPAGAGSLDGVLQVAGHSGNDSRIVFSTVCARFDVWVDSKEVRSEPTYHSADPGFLGCGVGGGSFSSHWYGVSEDTPVLVAEHPTGEGHPGLTVKKGASLHLAATENGWTEIFPIETNISPPAGMHYWVPSKSFGAAD